MYIFKVKSKWIFLVSVEKVTLIYIHSLLLITVLFILTASFIPCIIRSISTVKYRITAWIFLKDLLDCKINVFKWAWYKWPLIDYKSLESEQNSSGQSNIVCVLCWFCPWIFSLVPFYAFSHRCHLCVKEEILSKPVLEWLQKV